MPRAGAAAAERRPTVVDESWFGAFGATGDSPALIEDSRFAASWQNETDSGRERRRGSRTIAETTFERIFGAFIAARAAIGVALIVTLALTGAFGLRPSGRWSP